MNLHMRIAKQAHETAARSVCVLVSQLQEEFSETDSLSVTDKYTHAAVRQWGSV